ncbi:MAG: HNH endonuclease [Elainellaceae cyanobacterium]
MAEDGKNIKLSDLFWLADRIGNKRYHRLTAQDLEDYQKFEEWRYVNGNSKFGSTPESKRWVQENSEFHCPICGMRYGDRDGRTIDHKLPRAQYPWLSLDFKNLWVICKICNQEKGEMHWYEYEHYIYLNHPKRYDDVRFARPSYLLKTLKE